MGWRSPETPCLGGDLGVFHAQCCSALLARQAVTQVSSSASCSLLQLWFPTLQHWLRFRSILVALISSSAQSSSAGCSWWGSQGGHFAFLLETHEGSLADLVMDRQTKCLREPS